jgi:ABC-type lipoprotein export system ATPase subunit
MSDGSRTILRFDHVSMIFAEAGRTGRRVLQDVSFTLPPGEAIALEGRSGSGKSTLLHLAAGIAVPTEGRVILVDLDLTAASEAERTALRGRHVGLVFQFFHLLPHLSVRENVALPAWVAGERGAPVDRRSMALLDRVGLADRAPEPVARLSGGEMQRVAICRALLRSPRLVLADEPTGSLDDTTGRQVMDLLLELVRDEGGTLLYVTHSRELTGLADRTWRLHDGILETGGPS